MVVLVHEDHLEVGIDQVTAHLGLTQRQARVRVLAGQERNGLLMVGADHTIDAQKRVAYRNPSLEHESVGDYFLHLRCTSRVPCVAISGSQMQSATTTCWRSVAVLHLDTRPAYTILVHDGDPEGHVDTELAEGDLSRLAPEHEAHLAAALVHKRHRLFM